MILTLFIVPVGYRLLVPVLPAAPVKADVAEFVEPLPDVSVVEVIAILEYLNTHGGEADVFRIAHDMQREFTHVVSIVKAAEMLGFVDTPKQTAVLTAKGKQFVEAGPEERRTLWRDSLLNLGLFREIHDVLLRQPDHAVDRDFVLETIIVRMPYESYERMFNIIIRWAWFGDLFVYDDATQKLSLKKHETPPGGGA
jgi:NitT/TauT family transport system ATP-binding protein